MPRKIEKKNKKNDMFHTVIDKIKNSPLYGTTLMVFFMIVMVIKTIIIYYSYKHLDPASNVISYLASDIVVLVIIQILVIVNSLIKRKYRIIIDILIFLILVLFCIDIFTIFFFQSRVTVLAMLMIWGNGWSGFGRIVSVWLFIALVIFYLVFLFIKSIESNKQNHTKQIILFSSTCFVCYSLFYTFIEIVGINTKYEDNIITLNIFQNIKELGSEHDGNINSYKDYITNVRWGWKDLNVILVFAESLSAIDSKNMWWNDNMPNFDSIQRDWIIFSNFITNWTTSDTAHISTLYGIIPLINMWANSTPYSGYKLEMEPLPSYLNTQWYNTTFISAVSLDFLNQRAFLSWAGFQKIIGEELFTWNKKYTFESAPDGDLYEEVLKEIKNQTWKYFIWLQTISFHRPYDVPYWKTEKLALKYSDEKLYDFYNSLREIWFFNSWILIVVWDHRKMNSVDKWEYDIFWPNRYTKSVATVVWSWITAWSVNSNIIQHTDLYNSLKRFLWHWWVSVDKTYNDIFSNKTNRDWAITNAEFYEINRYTVTSNEWVFLFRNPSSLLGKNKEIYDYFSSYLLYEFWEKKSLAGGTETKYIWHRWAIDVSPENTLESFLSAKEQGADWIEFDVSYTKDKQNIVVHWNELYSSNCTKNTVWNNTLKRINNHCTIINGEKYRTLKEMLELIDWLFDYYFLEIKVYNEKLWAQQTLDAIKTVKELNMQDRVIFISYSDSARKVLESQNDIIYWWDTFDMWDIDFIWENNSKYFLAPYDKLSYEIVQKVRAMWKEIATYTVNDIWSLKKMKDLWVNIILTDKISKLRKYDMWISDWKAFIEIIRKTKKPSRETWGL